MNAPEARTGLRQRLLELRRRYAAELPERVGCVTHGLLEGGPARWQAQRADLEAQAHSLAGGAGSYGFEPVGVWARALEWALKADPAVSAERCQGLARGLAAAAAEVARRTAITDPPDAARVDLVYGEAWPALGLATRLREAGFEVAVHDDAGSWPGGEGQPAPQVRLLDPSLAGAEQVAEAGGAGPLLVLAPGPVRAPWEQVARQAAAWYLQPPDPHLLERAVMAAATGAPAMPCAPGSEPLDGEHALRAGLAESLASVAERGETLALVYFAPVAGVGGAVLGERLPRRCRPADLVAPLGGEGWAAALPDCGAEAAARFAREFCRGTPHGQLRAGIAVYPLADSPDALLVAARRGWAGARADAPVSIDRGEPARS